MDNRDKLISELGAEYGIKKENETNSRFQYNADTNTLLRKSLTQRAVSEFTATHPEMTTHDVSLEKDEYVKVLNETTHMLLILDNGVKVGHTLKVLEHESLVATGRFVLKEVVEIIKGSETGPLSQRFCVVLLK